MGAAVIKNAIAYVLRKKTRTLIVFVILTLVLSCLYICLSIMRTSENLEQTLYQSSNSSLSITKRDADGYFEISPFAQTDQIKEITQSSPQYEGPARLTNAKAVEGEQAITRDDLTDGFKNLVSIEAGGETDKNVLFSSGTFSLKEGRGIQRGDSDALLVHEEFARKNKLKVNDEIRLEYIDSRNADRKLEERTYKIVGIFSGKKQERYTGLSSDLSENMMFADYASSQKGLGLSENQWIASKITLSCAGPEKMDEAIRKIQELPADWSQYRVDKNTSAFQEAIEAIGGVRHMIGMMTYAIMAGGVVVLSLILILWLRERIYEIGILLSIGVGKVKIVGQFLVELILISIPTSLAAFVVGSLAVRQIAGGLLGADQTASLMTNLPTGAGGASQLLVFVQSYGVLAAVIAVSVIIASAMILIKKPKEILSQIS